MHLMAGLQENMHAAVLSDDPGFVVCIAGQAHIGRVTHFLVCPVQAHTCWPTSTHAPARQSFPCIHIDDVPAAKGSGAGGIAFTGNKLQ